MRNVCCICEEGPDRNVTCSRCVRIEERVRELHGVHPKDPGWLCWVVVPRDPQGGVPQLAKALPIVLPQQQHQELQNRMGALWGTREDAEEVLEGYASTDEERAYWHVRPVVVTFFVGDTGEGTVDIDGTIQD